MNIDFIGSPNYMPGRQGTKIDRIVIHWANGTLQATDQTFQDVKRQTSAHYGVEDGVIHRYVEEEDTAYHSGDWPMNLRSIGIEHSAQPGREASETTYQTSAQLIRDICDRYSIPMDRAHIIKHSEVTPTQCPGTVDIDRLIALAKEGKDMTTQEATAVLDSFFWNFVGRKVKPSELEEYVPYFVAGLPDKFFKKAKDFSEVKLGSSDTKLNQAKDLAKQIQGL
jgi:N-acetyl-anhydromuramyl-L-alanine amidase AmpD